MDTTRILKLCILFFIICSNLDRTSGQVYVGSHCAKHSDCVRYCAYSKYGMEGASCCFPEKIRMSRTEWVETGSNTCYCCALYDDPEVWNEKNFYVTPNKPFGGKVIGGGAGEEACSKYLLEEQEQPLQTRKLNGEFCNKKCVQVMLNVKIAMEFPSVCRS